MTGELGRIAGNGDRSARRALPDTLLGFAEQEIKAAIADGTVAPGERLSPNALAEELGISHIPVREALASLSSAGFIVHHRSRGFFARDLTNDDLADIYRWRAVLEREAFMSAVPVITDEDIAEMRRLAGLMEDKTDKPARSEYLRLNREFHFVAFKRAGSDRLLRFLNYLWDVAAPYQGIEFPDVESATTAYEEHLELVKLFEARDTQGVIAAMNAHRQRRIQRIAEVEASKSGATDVTGAAKQKRRVNSKKPRHTTK